MYPKVFVEYAAHLKQFSDVSPVPTDVFFYGLRKGEETEVEIEKGKTLFIKLVAVSEANEEGRRTLFFELNGSPREVTVVDRSLAIEVTRRLKADPQTRGIPIIALSAHALAGAREKALAAGCDEFDTKPIEFERLLATLRRLLADHK